MSNQSDDAFAIDIRQDLERIDRVMTQIVNDPATIDEFIRDPNGVLARLGLHPPASRAIHDRVNKIFYAVLTNTELINFIVRHFESFTSPAAGDQSRISEEALARGELQSSIQFDLDAADHVFRQPDALREVYRLTLYDLNERGLLQNSYTPEQLDNYIEQLTEAILARRPLREIPKLEEWDEHYGVGTGYGVGEIEIGPVATLISVVEAGVSVTADPVALLITPTEDRATMLIKAHQGDTASIRKLATLSALSRLTSQMLVYAHNFSSRRR
ncbi:hypothetical protein [Kitasatospora sp. NPDC127116]|uniref:hypothetical protein n=1 Tax=Kitasatospora sp. NPDC127116 TaxID=3345367 RepID=UPI00364081C2